MKIANHYLLEWSIQAKNIYKGKVASWKTKGGPIKSFKNFEQKIMFPFFRTNENNVKLGAKNVFGGESPIFLL
jgi:hypothetical protein